MGSRIHVGTTDVSQPGQDEPAGRVDITTRVDSVMIPDLGPQMSHLSKTTDMTGRCYYYPV